MFLTETFSSKKCNITLLNSKGLHKLKQLIFASMKSLTPKAGVAGNMEYIVFTFLHLFSATN